MSDFTDKAYRTHTVGTILLEIELDGKTLYLSDKYITVGSNLYQGLISDFGSAGVVGGSGSLAEMSDITISAFNKAVGGFTSFSRFSELVSSYSFEGRNVRFLQYFDGLTYSDCEVFFSGKIDTVGFDALEITFDIIANDEVYRTVPIGRITKREFSTVDEEFVGMAKPVIYGKSPDRSLISQKDWCVFPSIMTDKRTQKHLIADHAIGAASMGTADNFPVVYIEELKKYLTLFTAPNDSYSNTDAGAFHTFNQGLAFTLALRPTVIGDQYDVVDTDFSNAIDESDSTTFTVPAGKLFYLKFDTLPDLGPIDPANLKLRITIDSATGSSPYATMKYSNAFYDGGVGQASTGETVDSTSVSNGYEIYTFGQDYSAHGDADDQADRENAWRWDELSKYEFGFTVNAGCTLTITDIVLLVYNLPSRPNSTVRNYRRQPSRGRAVRNG